MRAPRTYYEILGISQTASAPELKSAYRRLVRQAHPDMGGSSALLDMVNEAYETLKDPFSRAKYDVGVRQGANTAESGSTQEAASEATNQQRQREENERTQQRQREAQAQQARQREENERTQQRQREDRREAQAQQARNAAEAKRRAKARKRVGALVSFPAVALIWWAATRGGSQPEQPQ